MAHPQMLNDALMGRGANNPEALARAQRNLAARRAGGQRQPRRKPHKLTPQQERNREIRRGYGEDILRDHGKSDEDILREHGRQMDKAKEMQMRGRQPSSPPSPSPREREADKWEDAARELREMQMRGRQPSSPSSRNSKFDNWEQKVEEDQRMRNSDPDSWGGGAAERLRIRQAEEAARLRIRQRQGKLGY